MKNPFTNENSNLSHIFHNNIHRKKVESLKVRSTEEFLCQFSLLPCRFFRGRRQGRQPLNNIQIQSYTCILYIQYIYIYHSHVILCFLFVWRNSNPLIKSSTFHTQWLAIWGGSSHPLVIKPGSGTYSIDTDDLQIRTPILRVMFHCRVWVQKGTT